MKTRILTVIACLLLAATMARGEEHYLVGDVNSSNRASDKIYFVLPQDSEEGQVPKWVSPDDYIIRSGDIEELKAFILRSRIVAEHDMNNNKALVEFFKEDKKFKKNNKWIQDLDHTVIRDAGILIEKLTPKGAPNEK